MEEDEVEMSKEEFRRWIRDQLKKMVLLTPGIYEKYSFLESLLERREEQTSNLLQLCQSVAACEKAVKELYSLLRWEYRDSGSDDGDEPTSCGRTQLFHYDPSKRKAHRPPTTSRPAPHRSAPKNRANRESNDTSGHKRILPLKREPVVVLTRLSRSQINKALRPQSAQSGISDDESLNTAQSDIQWEPEDNSSESDFSLSEFNTGSNKRRKLDSNTKLKMIHQTARKRSSLAKRKIRANVPSSSSSPASTHGKFKVRKAFQASPNVDSETNMTKAETPPLNTAKTTAAQSTATKTTSGPNTTKMATSGPNTTKMATSGPNTTKMATSGLNTTKTATSGSNISKTATSGPNTTKMATSGPNKTKMATSGPNTTKMATSGPNATKMATSGPNKIKSATSGPNKTKSATSGPNTSKTATSGPNTSKTATSRPSTTKMATSGLKTTKMATSGPKTTQMATSGPRTSKTATPGPNTSKTATSQPNVTKMATSGLNTTKMAASRPNVTKMATSQPKTTETTSESNPDSNAETGAVKMPAPSPSAKVKGVTPVNNQPSEATKTPLSQPQVELSVNMTVLARRRALSWKVGKITEIITKEDGRIKYKVIFEEKERSLVSSHHIAFHNTAKLSFLFVGARVVIKRQAEKTEFMPGILAELPSRKNRMRFLIFIDDHTPVYAALPLLHLVCKPLPDPLDDIPYDNHRNFMKKYLKSWPYPAMTHYRVGNSLNIEYNGEIQKCEVITVDSSLVEVIFLNDEHKEWVYRGSMRLDYQILSKEQLKNNKAPAVKESSK